MLLQAQALVMSVGSSQNMVIKSGTLFGADSLVLIPGTDFTLSSNTVQVSQTPILGSPYSSINRVYYLGNQVNFNGTIQIYYKLSELDGNTENLLDLYDSTASKWWNTEVPSIVNTTTHYVQYSATNHLLVGATAAQIGTVLAVNLIFFGGSWFNDDVLLSWTVSRSDPDTKYQVEYSPDGSQWSILGDVYGVVSTFPVSFCEKDADQQFTRRFYRVRIIEDSGNPILSNVIQMDRLSLTNSIKIASRSRGAIFYFAGQNPGSIRVMNMAGQVIWQSLVSSSEYEVSDLIAGVYLVQYGIGNTPYTKKFLVQ